MSYRTIQSSAKPLPLTTCAKVMPVHLSRPTTTVILSASLSDSPPRFSHLPPTVVHCFTGSLSQLRCYLDMGFSIGITGWICDERRGLTLQEIVKYIPLDRLMIETDAPWLLPRDIRPRPKKRRNEPIFLRHIAQAVAHYMGKEATVVAQSATQNAKRFFGLPSA